MLFRDYVDEIVKVNKFKPDNTDKVKAFINSYIYNIYNLFMLENKDYIVYLSGPVTNIDNYKSRFDEMELDTYKALSAYNIYIINPIKVISVIEEYNFSYTDKVIICYCLQSISNLLVYDNRDEYYKSSIGTFSEISYAMGKGIEIVDYLFIKETIRYKEGLVVYDAIENLKYVMRTPKEIIEKYRETCNKDNPSKDEIDIEEETKENETA